MNKYLLSSGVLLLLATSLQSCRDDKDYYDPDLTQKWIEESFDFKTTTDLNVTFNTGTKKLVRIYNANPQETPAAKEIYAAFTDDNGNYNGSATISSIYNGKTLYALVDGQVYEVKATSNGLQLSTAANRAASRAVDYEKLATDIYNDIVKKLPEGYKGQSINATDEKGNVITDPKETPYKTKAFNAEDSIAYLGGEIQDATHDLDIKTAEGLEVKTMFSFSGAGEAFHFDLYYYYYPANQDTHAKYNSTGEGFKLWVEHIASFGNKYLLYSNFSGGYDGNGDNKTPRFPKGIIKDLKFYGPDMTGNEGVNQFPEGYKIGFVLKWRDKDYAGNVYPKYTTGWPNWSCRPDGGGWGCNRQVARFHYGRITENSEQNEVYVYAIEDIGYNWVGGDDGCDRDFNDCIFAVITNQKIESNTGGEIPDIKPEEPEEPEEPDPKPEEHTSTFNGLLLFEDLFPSQGDYDMNDVVVEYQYAVTFDTNNIVKKIEATYTPRWDGADYSSAFGIQLENKAKDILSNRTIFRDHKFTKTGQPITGEITGQQFTVDITPTSEVSKDDLVFNPYITVSTGYEVHLTKMQPTASFATNQLYQKLNDAEKAYVTVGSKFPYALDIFEATYANFSIVTERKRIDSEYTDFTKWVDKNASEYTDWWKN